MLSVHRHGCAFGKIFCLQKLPPAFLEDIPGKTLEITLGDMESKGSPILERSVGFRS